MENAVLSLKDTVRMFFEGLFKKEESPKIQETKEKLSIDEIYKGDDPLMTALREAAKACEGAANEAGLKTEEEFNDYFFNEFRPAYLKEWKKEHGYA